MEIGTRVNRIENRTVVGATVIAIDGNNLLLSYDEGGEGWWPLETVEEQVNDMHNTQGSTDTTNV